MPAERRHRRRGRNRAVHCATKCVGASTARSCDWRMPWCSRRWRAARRLLRRCRSRSRHRVRAACRALLLVTRHRFSPHVSTKSSIRVDCCLSPQFSAECTRSAAARGSEARREGERWKRARAVSCSALIRRHDVEDEPGAERLSSRSAEARGVEGGATLAQTEWVELGAKVASGVPPGQAWGDRSSARPRRHRIAKPRVPRGCALDARGRSRVRLARPGGQSLGSRPRLAPQTVAMMTRSWSRSTE